MQIYRFFIIFIGEWSLASEFCGELSFKFENLWCVMECSQSNVKKRYEGGGGVKNSPKKRYVIVEWHL